MKSLSTRLLFSLSVILVMTFFPVISNSANPWMSDYILIGTYPGAHTLADPIEVYGILDKNGEYGVAIELHPLFGKEEKTKFILLKDFELPSFLNILKKVRDKSREWTTIARENNVSDYSKQYDINCDDVYGLTTPDSEHGAGLWKCEKWDIGTKFFVATGDNYMYTISFWGEGESGDAKGKNDFFDLTFHKLNQMDELINILEPTNVKSKLRTGGSSSATPKTNYDSLFK